MQSKPAVLTGLSALLLTFGAPVPLAAQRAIVPPDDRYSPVRCRSDDRPGYNYAPTPVTPMPKAGKVRRDNSAQDLVVTGSRVTANDARRAAPTPSYAPPPPPAPMPPPPMAYAPSAGMAGSYAAPPYGSRRNTERYDGKAVASIQAVSASPVSTFSVDVDTGSYSNVRRFLTEATRLRPRRRQALRQGGARLPPGRRLDRGRRGDPARL